MIYIINFGSNKTPQIESVVKALKHDCKVIPWRQEQLIDFKKAKAFILSGAPVRLTETDPHEYLEKYQFLKTINIPVLGICFGHQLLGLLNGSKIYKGPEIDEEVVTINILVKDSLFDKLPKNPLFEEDHTEGIDKLPAGFIHLAYSAEYQIEAMKHSTKNIYGVQFHPEISEHNGKLLIQNFLKKI